MSDVVPILDIIEHIHKKNKGIAQFWSGAEGWAPVAAARLLSKSMLDWQVSLSQTLSLWVRPNADSLSPDGSGRLILGWANLGSLVEGSLKWFLSVYYENYKADLNVLRDQKKGALKEPDVIALEELRNFFKRSIWTSSEEWDAWVLHIQQRRNAIHAYKHRDIGTIEELENDIRKYWQFLNDLDGRVPYPDEMYRP